MLMLIPYVSVNGWLLKLWRKYQKICLAMDHVPYSLNLMARQSSGGGLAIDLTTIGQITTNSRRFQFLAHTSKVIDVKLMIMSQI